MINLLKTTTRLARRILITKQTPLIFLFSQNKALDPKYTRIKQTFMKNGKDSNQYQLQMSKAMKEALEKYDNQEAINLELFHLGLLKDSEGQKSEHYRTQVRQVARFCINRQNYVVAENLVRQLKILEQKIQDIRPLDVISTTYLHGYILMQLQKFEESKQCFKKCLNTKEAQQGQQVFFKIFSDLGRVHIKCGQNNEARQIIMKCQQIIKKRKINESAPSLIKVMDLNDIFSLAQLVSMINDKQLSQKYLKLYEERLEKCSNMKDPMYAEFVERKAKIYLNLKEYSKTVELLREGVRISTELSKVDPRYQQNASVLSNIADSVEKECGLLRQITNEIQFLTASNWFMAYFFIYQSQLQSYQN